MYDFLSTLLITLTYWEVWVTFGLLAIIFIALPKTQEDMEQISADLKWLGEKIEKATRKE
jgi:hypothetical protein